MRGALEQRANHQPFAGVAGNERDLVHPPGLPDAAHSTLPLMQPGRCPRQLEVNDKAAVVVEIQAFGRRIRGNQERAAAAEPPEHGRPLACREPAVHHRTSCPAASSC